MTFALASQLSEPNRAIILDGGLGTHLADLGHDVTGELWSASILRDEPGAVRHAHADFFQAGAEVATTCSYQVTFDGLQQAGASRAETEALLRSSVGLARDAADAAADGRGEQRFVFASVGPYGAGPGRGTEYDGNYELTVSQLRAWHRPRLEILADTSADVLLIETVPSIREVEALVSEISDLGMPALLSMTVRGGALGDGTPLREAATVALDAEGLLGIGVNCCSVKDAVTALTTFSDVTGLPLLAYPNSGEEWDHVSRRWIPGPPSGDLPGAASDLVAVGAKLVGGCCRVGPGQIARLVAALDV